MIELSFFIGDIFGVGVVCWDFFGLMGLGVGNRIYIYRINIVVL